MLGYQVWIIKDRGHHEARWYELNGGNNGETYIIQEFMIHDIHVLIIIIISIH